MLSIYVNDNESYDEESQKYTYDPNKREIFLEHSLLSISRWEEEFKKPFLDSDKTVGEMVKYITYMCVNESDIEDLLNSLNPKKIKDIEEYLLDKRTATEVYYNKPSNIFGKPKKDIITSEIIYYYMFSAGIPIECEKWNLNKLLTLIEVFSVKNNPKQNKMSRQDTLKSQRELNDLRRKNLGTKG
jgi:hypothetical protein